ncbi:copper homeostasis membrane protein CopD [Pantoea sp. CCBC3-3-1]|uniref:copper homeostasis membrane protein CopD n=1 Tax=Pantoea sp. CCBC3-3-1 TaxID=2490851 RepID=UPI0011BD4B3E|nr:copper homeostasis membrane protein CopD [Pantoea sp. CCBC3-3-1]
MSLSFFYILCRWLHFTALMTLAGGSLYTALLAPARFRETLTGRFHRLLTLSAWAALATAILLLAAQTGLMGNGWQDISNLSVWRAAAQTRFGQAWQWQLLMAAVSVAALLLKGRVQQLTWLFSAAGQLAGLAFVGHAAMLDGVAGGIQRGIQIVHLLSAAFWAGGLLPVLLLMREARQLATRYDAIRTMMRFSSWGHLAVALVIITGMLNAMILLPEWPPAHLQPYTMLLLAKTLLVMTMCGIALYNRYSLVPRFQRSGARAQHTFMLTTLAEVFLSALVLLLVSVFATLEPA